jgi:hypothetical protein
MNHSILNITKKPSYHCGFIYLLCAGDVFKIGVTEQTIEKRIRDLQTGNHEEIWCRDYVEVPRKYLYGIERMMHLKNHVSKIKNEWYELPIEAIASFRADCRKSLEILEMLDETEF